MTDVVERRPPVTYFRTLRELERANRYIFDLESALEIIARKQIMDSVTAISMRALATAVLSRRK